MGVALGWVGGTRIRGRMVLTAVWAGALLGAGQLGVAYGLGIVDLARSFGPDTGNQWNAQLAWVSWFAVLATVGGAVAAERLARRHQYTPGVGTRILVALSGGLGAVAVIPLSMRPAGAADLAQAVDPALVVGLAAGLGAVAGVLVAIVALSLRPLAWNLSTVAVAVWLAGLAAVGPYLGPDDAAPSIRLGVPQWTDRAGETDRLVEMLGMPVLALLAGLAVAAVARGRREPRLGTAVSGIAGAVPLALAYLIAGPGANGHTADQTAPYLGALIAIPAGLLGSLLVALIARRGAEATTGSRPAPAATAGSDSPRPPGMPLEPSNIIPPVGPAAQWDPRLHAGGPPPRRTPGVRFPAGA